jgi:hypothetical protein
MLRRRSNQYFDGYSVLLTSETKRLDLSEGEWHVVRQETLDYVAALRTSGHLLDARPLRSATTASTLRIRDGKLLVADGPFAETKE